MADRNADIGSASTRYGGKAAQPAVVDEDGIPDTDDWSFRKVGEDVNAMYDTTIDNSNMNFPYSSLDTVSLKRATATMLNQTLFPLGSLSANDVAVMKRLMIAWPQRRSISAALTVEQLLKRIVEEMHVTEVQELSSSVFVDTEMYVACINAWSLSADKSIAASRAQAIHDAMVRQWHETGNSCITPSTASYNALLGAWSNHVRYHYDDSKQNRTATECAAKDANTQAEAILVEMMSGDENVHPDDVTLSRILDVYSRSITVASESSSNAAVVELYVARCARLVEMFHTEWGVIPAATTYLALQHAYVRSGLDDAPTFAGSVLHRMIDDYKNGISNRKRLKQGASDQILAMAKPVASNFNAVLYALSKNPNYSNALKAITLLQRMELPASKGGFDVEPNHMSYALAILTCARCPDVVFGARTSETLLEKMEARAMKEARRRFAASSMAPPTVGLDIECFNVVLTAISRCRQRDAPPRALRIIQRMERYAKVGENAVRPNIRSWNAVLNTYARASASKRNFARSAEALLDHLTNVHLGGVPKVKPDAFTYSAVLSAYQTSKDPEAARRADAIVRTMEKMYENGEIDDPPDTYHYTILCGTWARSRSSYAADRVLQILARMVERSENGFPNVKPNTRTYNAVLDCLARFGDGIRAESILYHQLRLFRSGDKDATPDAFSFNSVIKAHTRSKKQGAGKKAETILDRFHEYQEEENPSVVVTARSFGLIISYYSRSRSPDAPYRAEYVLNRMLSRLNDGQSDLVPSDHSIVQVIEAYANAGHTDAGKNADRLLKTVRRLNCNDYARGLVVNTPMMNAVLLAWANSGDENAGQRAEKYLDEMEVSYRNGFNEMVPDSKSYCLVLSAWSKSISNEKFRRALLVLRRMEEQQKCGNSHVLVDEHARSLVINTCAFSNVGSEVKSEAFDVACTVFDEMMNSSDSLPTSVSFGWFIQAVGRLCVDEERANKHIEDTFKICCEAGLVNDFVMQRLKGAASETTYHRLVQSATEGRRLRQEWKRNSK